MAKPKSLVRLLVLSDAPNEAERLANLFRNHGRAARPHQLTDIAGLQQALQQDWDLIVVAPHVENIPDGKALALVRGKKLDTPLIQLLDGQDWSALGKAIEAGATTAIPLGDDQCLLQVANRELNNLDDRRQLKRMEKSLKEAENRCQLLLDSSVTAIGYVHDGMHIYANYAYLRLFGYEELDDLLGIPLMDLILCDDQKTFRTLLKEEKFLEDPVELDCQCQTQDGQSVGAKLTLSSAHYEDEPCLQLLISHIDQDADLNEKIISLQGQDPLTGLFNRNRLIEFVDLALSKNTTVTLAYLRIDNFAVQLAELGVSGTDELQVQMAELLNEDLPEGASAARVTDGAFALLLPGTATEQKVHLNALLKKAQEHVFEASRQSFQISLSGGVTSSELPGSGTDIYDRANEAAHKAANGEIKTYDPAEALAAAADRGNEVAALKYALTTESIRLLYQPTLNLREGDADYYEVIPLPLDSRGQPLDPEEAILAVEEEGDAQLVIDYDRWILSHAIKALADKRGASGETRTRLIVPLARSSLLDAKLLDWLTGTLKENGLAPDALVLMITETTAVSHLKQARELCEALEPLHSALAVNHFGKVSAPMKTLSQLPAKFAKLDPDLLKELGEAHNIELLKTTLGGLQSHGVASILPDINSASTLAQIWQAGAEYIQGEYIQQPSRAMDYSFRSE